MPLTKTAALLDSNPHVITSKRGVEAYGVYVETVEVYPNGTANWYNRIFIAGTTISYYHRPAGSTRTTWKLFTYPTVEKAEAQMLRFMSAGHGRSIILRGAPILVQLEPVDVSAINDGQMPGARYRGNNTHESLFGKFVADVTVKPEPMSKRGFEAADLAMAVRKTAAPPTPTSATGEPY